jgi:hypothetical protein
MKSTITILGFVALSFTNANATTEFETQVLDQQESATLIVENTQQNQLVFATKEISDNAGDSNNTETAVFDPKSVIETTYVKTVEDVILQDKLITESKEAAFYPLSLGYTAEDRIAEDNQIIESAFSNEAFPLDFDKINSNIQCVKMNNNALKNADVKL